MNSKSLVFLAGAVLCVCLPSHADVPTPPTPPAIPAGYCTTISTEVQGYMDTFNASIGTPPPSTVLRSAQLQQADSNAGPSVSNGLATSLLQAQELQAMGFGAVKISIGFPLLYEPFWGSQSAMQPYLTYYQNLVTSLHQMGMKVIVENTILLSNDVEAGWTNLTPFFAGLTWPAYESGRAAMAATIAQQINPDYLILAEEPDTEAFNTGQTNVNNPVDAAAMILEMITSVRLVNLTIPLGAGFGTWLGAFPPSGLLDYLTEYVALPLDYIDYHVYPILTWQGVSYLTNALTIAQQAALVGKPVAVSESWLWKTENSEYTVQPSDFYRQRDPFPFWTTLDKNFGQTMQNIAYYTQANYTKMLYLSAQGSVNFFAQQNYGGTTANGGAANCTCTTDSCTESIILNNANLDGSAADQVADFTQLGFDYNQWLVPTKDTQAPTEPTGLAVTAGYNTATLSWKASTDNVGVAGYNVLRCAPNPPSSPCTGVWIANTASTSFVDYGPLNAATQYNYQVQAFDMANNNSPLSAVYSVTTAGSFPPTSPTNVVATATSPTEIQVTWTAPASGTVSQYQVWSGTSPTTLAQIATLPGTSLKYTNLNLGPRTAYYYGIIAIEAKLPSPMSNIAHALTLPLPNAPVGVKATAGSSSKITLTWKEVLPPSGLAIANYQVYAGPAPGDVTKIATTTQTTYTNTGLTPGTTYYYEIIAVDTSFNDSVPSDAVGATTLPLPATPTNVKATASSATKFTVTWSWTQGSGLPLGHFNIFCGTSPTGETKAGQATADTFTDTQATAGTTYYCYVQAVDTANDTSANSATTSVTTPPAPNPPSNVTATANSSTKVTVTWTETIPSGGLSVTSYKVYRNTTLPVTTANFIGQSQKMTYTDLTVTGGTTYYYAVSAIDSGQDASALSSPAKVTTP